MTHNPKHALPPPPLSNFTLLPLGTPPCFVKRNNRAPGFSGSRLPAEFPRNSFPNLYLQGESRRIRNPKSARHPRAGGDRNRYTPLVPSKKNRVRPVKLQTSASSLPPPVSRLEGREFGMDVLLAGQGNRRRNVDLPRFVIVFCIMDSAGKAREFYTETRNSSGVQCRRGGIKPPKWPEGSTYPLPRLGRSARIPRGRDCAASSKA